MTRRYLLLLCLVVLIGLDGVALAQRNPRGTSQLRLKGTEVSVEYGRPALKGRSVEQLLAQLKPGQVWRLGADKATGLSTSGDLTFGNTPIPKGDYSLFARREADQSWSLVFNKQHGQWGTQHDPAQDVAAVPLKESKAPKVEEMVTIGLAKEGRGGVLTVQWGEMKLSTNFKAK